MEDKIKKIETYIHNNEDGYISITSLKQMILVFSFISIFAFVSIVFRKALPWSAILILLTVIYMIYVFSLQHKSKSINTFSLRFKVNATFSLYCSVYFLILAFCLLSFSTKNPTGYIFIALFFVALGILYNCSTLHLLRKRGYFNYKKSKKSKLSLFSLIGGLLGVGCARVFRTTLSSNLMVDLGAFFACVVSYLCLAGTTNFIKYYYSIKYKVNADITGNNSSVLLIERRKKTNDKKRISLIFPTITIIILFVLVVVGVILQKK